MLGLTSRCCAGTSSHGASQEDVLDYKVVVGLCAAVSLICSIDRASISVAIVPMAEQFGWSDSVKGAISSSFFIGYTITNLIGKLCTEMQVLAGALLPLPVLANKLPEWHCIALSTRMHGLVMTSLDQTALTAFAECQHAEVTDSSQAKNDCVP